MSDISLIIHPLLPRWFLLLAATVCLWEGIKMYLRAGGKIEIRFGTTTVILEHKSRRR